jgi:hypothetical protein
MKARQDRFVRLKYDKLEAEHPLVWFGPALATYSRLLSACDKAWPSLPELPSAARRADLALLRSEGLLLDQDHRRFTLKGYAKDRGERENRAKRAAGARWDADARTDAYADARPSAMPTPTPVPVPTPRGSTNPLTYTARAGVRRLVDPVEA